jgi:hypothetical protein
VLAAIGVRRMFRGPVTVWPNNAVAVNSNGNGLGITKAIRRRMTACTRVVIIQASDGVEPEQTPKVGQLMVYLTTDPLFERGFDSAREAGVLKGYPQFSIQRARAQKFYRM